MAVCRAAHCPSGGVRLATLSGQGRRPLPWAVPALLRTTAGGAVGARGGATRCRRTTAAHHGAAGARAEQRRVCTGALTPPLLRPAQVILGSQPHDDGTFDRTNTFTTLVSNGAWSVPSADAARRADQVAYIVPAAKGAAALHCCTPPSADGPLSAMHVLQGRADSPGVPRGCGLLAMRVGAVRGAAARGELPSRRPWSCAACFPPAHSDGACRCSARGPAFTAHAHSRARARYRRGGGAQATRTRVSTPARATRASATTPGCCCRRSTRWRWSCRPASCPPARCWPRRRCPRCWCSASRSVRRRVVVVNAEIKRVINAMHLSSSEGCARSMVPRALSARFAADVSGVIVRAGRTALFLVKQVRR